MPESLSEHIVKQAEGLGFDACGIASAERLADDAARMEQWLAEGCHGTMGYLERNRDKRYDPSLLVEGTKSVVTVICNYYPSDPLRSPDNYHLAKYAYGADYHEVMKAKLRVLLDHIVALTGPLPGSRCFVDSAPVLDRAWAQRSGLGFIGKNTSLIHPKKGSFFFIGHLFLPIALSPVGQPLANRCGTCTRCLDACPTGALDRPFHLDARRCISYLTIEHHGPIQGVGPHQFHDWVYGCDVCQDVCPYNRFSVATLEPAFQPSEALKAMRKADWQQLDADAFHRLFAHSAVQRAGIEGVKRNVRFVEGKQDDSAFSVSDS